MSAKLIESPLWRDVTVCVCTALIALLLVSQQLPNLQVEFSLFLEGSSDIAPYTLWGLIQQIGGANAWPLAVGLTLWSGVWPILKLVIMVLGILDVLPVASLKQRDRILQVTAHLGKWSMLDVYVMLTVAISLRLDPVTFCEPVETGIVSTIRDDLKDVTLEAIGAKPISSSSSSADCFNLGWVKVQPQSGILLFALSTVCSQVIADELARRTSEHKMHQKSEVPMLPMVGVMFFVLATAAILVFTPIFNLTYESSLADSLGLMMDNNTVLSFAGGIVGIALQDPITCTLCVLGIWVVLVAPTMWVGFVLSGRLAISELLQPWVHLDIFCVAILACSLYISQLSANMQPSAASIEADLTSLVGETIGDESQPLLQISLNFSTGLGVMAAMAVLLECVLPFKLRQHSVGMSSSEVPRESHVSA
eukprot:SAG31_NODE_195_length_20708_cov_9.627638_5_plen_422_part_00